MSKSVPRGALAVCLAVFWFCSTADRASSQEKKPDFQVVGEQEKPLPEGLRHVPDDAMGFVQIRIGDFLKSDSGKTLMEKLRNDPVLGKGLKSIDKDLGLPLSDVESVTLLFLDPSSRRADAAASAANNLKEMGEAQKKFNDAQELFPKVKQPDFKVPPLEFPKKLEGSDTKKPVPPAEIEKRKESRRNQQAPAWENVKVTGSSAVEAGPFARSPGELSLCIITSSKPLNRKKLLTTHVMSRELGSADYSILFLSDRSFLIGERHELVRFVMPPVKKNLLPGKLTTKATPPLRTVLELGAQPHLIVAGAQFSPSLRQELLESQRMEQGPAAIPLLPLLNVTSLGLTVDMGKSFDAKLYLNGGNARHAALAGEAAKTALVMIEIGLDEALGMAKKDKKALSPALVELLGNFRKSLAKASFEQKGNQAQLALSMEVDPAMIAVGLTEMVNRVKMQSYRVQSQNNLKQMALAMHSYHDVYRTLPPAGLGSINDKDGKPLLSWRVAILPFIEQVPLYQQFDMEKPWDHPHNKKLIAQMPPIYVLPGSKTKDGMTHYQVFVGPMTAFEPLPGAPRTGHSLVQIADGTSNTLMIAEAANPVIWTKPEDMPFDPDPKKALPKLGGVFEGGFNAAFCDGSVRFIPSTVSAEVLRALITRNGGEVVILPE